MSIILKPSVIASALIGKITLKPLIFATIVPVTPPEKATGETLRIVTNTEIINGNTIREVKSTEIAIGNTSRELYARDEFKGDTSRQIQAVEQFNGDTLRRIIEPQGAITIKPLIVATINFPEAVIGDTVRQITNTEKVNGNTSRRISAQEMFSGNTLRRLTNEVEPIGTLNKQVRIKWLIDDVDDYYTKVIPVLKTATNAQILAFCRELSKLVDGFVVSYEILDITTFYDD